MLQEILVGLIIVGAVVYVVLKLRKNAAGKGCGCGCAGCSEGKRKS